MRLPLRDDLMAKLKLEARSQGNKVWLVRTEMRWPDLSAPVTSSQGDWTTAARTDALLILFARYKLWKAEGKNEPFQLVGGRDSIAQALHYLLENSRQKPGHWAIRLFGKKRGDARSCRLEELVKVPERDGRYVASFVSSELPPENVEIVWHRPQAGRNKRPVLDSSADLLEFLQALGDASDVTKNDHHADRSLPLESDAKDFVTRMDVQVWNSSDGSMSGSSIQSPGVLPLRIGELIRISVLLSRKAHVYLTWINGRGKVYPLHPWTKDWMLASDDAPVRTLEVPAYHQTSGFKGIPLTGPPGLATVLLMVSEEALTEPFLSEVQDRLSGFPCAVSLRDPAALIRFAWAGFGAGQLPSERSGLDLDNLQPIDDPELEIRHFLMETISAYFSYVTGYRFLTTEEQRVKAAVTEA